MTIKEKTELFNCYADRLFYKIEKAAIYTKLRGSMLLNLKNAGLSIDQFITLETISANPDICQRDLSKIVLKDRSNITRILNILEEKGFITRELSIKGKRPVKIMKLTKSGDDLVKNNSHFLTNEMNDFLSEFKKDEIKTVMKILDRIIEKSSETVSIQI